MNRVPNNSVSSAVAPQRSQFSDGFQPEQAFPRVSESPFDIQYVHSPLSARSISTDPIVLQQAIELEELRRQLVEREKQLEEREEQLVKREKQLHSLELAKKPIPPYTYSICGDLEFTPHIKGLSAYKKLYQECMRIRYSSLVRDIYRIAQVCVHTEEIGKIVSGLISLNGITSTDEDFKVALSKGIIRAITEWMWSSSGRESRFLLVLIPWRSATRTEEGWIKNINKNINEVCLTVKNTLFQNYLSNRNHVMGDLIPFNGIPDRETDFLSPVFIEDFIKLTAEVIALKRLEKL